MRFIVLAFLLIFSFYPISVQANEISPDQKIVYLTNEEISFGIDETEILPKHPLPLMSWESGICFELGTMPEDNDQEREQLLKEVFGTFDKSKPIIGGSLIDNAGKTYQLEGKIKSEGYKRLEPDSTATDVIMCNCVACTERGKPKPDHISAIKIKAITPFKAQSVYWYTLKSKNPELLGETEDPLHRWRLLQEERVERQMKEKQEQRQGQGQEKSFWQWLFGQ